MNDRPASDNPMSELHAWDDAAELWSRRLVDYVFRQLHTPKDPSWGAHPRDELDAALSGLITPNGTGAARALRVFDEVLLPACRPMNDPMNLAYVSSAPAHSATLFDLVVSASSIFGGAWEAGAGAIAAENQALAWLAGLAGYPANAGGVFVSGGSAANLSALVTARHAHIAEHGRPEPAGRAKRLAVACTREVHSSVRAAANVMDVEVLAVDVDERGRMTGSALSAALDTCPHDWEVFAVCATGGTTNAGQIDELGALADVCATGGLHGSRLWLHVDGAYGLAALCSPTARPLFAGIERTDSFGVDPHKWLFAPYDCAALVYRDPAIAGRAHSQFGDYLINVDRNEWNPADYAYHLSRRVRGLPLWFALVTHGTDAFATAMDITLRTAHNFAAAVAAHPMCDLVVPPELSVVLFRRLGWTMDDYQTWSARCAKAGTSYIIPTLWRGEPVLRVCIVHPHTTLAALAAVLDDLV
jgi:glutamate/tyrosine decarboxylase-like PLP-dependent enzyme